MAKEQLIAEKRAEPLIDIQRPQQPQFDIDHQIARSLDDMRKTWDIAKDNWRRQSEFYQKHLEQLYKPLRGQIAQLDEESAHSLQEYFTRRQDFPAQHIDQRARRLIANERVSFIATTGCEH